MRSFIAVSLDDSLKQLIDRACQCLHEHSKEARYHWSPWVNFHITVCFLGDITDQQRQTLTDYVRKTVHFLTPFTLKLGRLMLFPKQHPRILAVSVKPKKEIMHLVKAIDKAAFQAGIRLETEPYLPHITIARLQQGDYPSINGIDIPHSEILVDRVILFRSDQKVCGSIYVPLCTIPLGK